MAEPEVTVDRLVTHAGTRLQAAGIVEGRREAWRIWCDLQGLPTYAGSVFSDATVPPPDAERFRHAVDRRAKGEPLPYVTGVAGFRQLVLRCDPRALIPRPETEGLVQHVLDRVPGGSVADVGTGSGCIALALAEEGHYDLVVGVDCFPGALALARENRHATGLGIELLAADLVSALGTETMDAIVSNPPYLTEAEYERLDPSVRDWEPREALVAGPDGLEEVRMLVGDALRAVRPGGWLALEVDASRARDTAHIVEQVGWSGVAIHDDLFGRARYLLARRSEVV